MKKKLQILMVVIFIGIIVGIPVIYNAIKIINGPDSEIVKSIDFDLNENRALNKFECNSIYDLPTAFENYFNDRIPFRSFFIQNKRDLESTIEKPYVEYNKKLADKKRKENRKQIKFEGDTTDLKFMDYAVRQKTNHALMPDEYDEVTDELFPFKAEGNVVVGKNNWLFLNSSNLIYYAGLNLMTDDEYKKYVEHLTNVQTLANKKGKNIIFLHMPEKEHVYSEYMPFMDIKDTVGKCGHIREYVASMSDVKYIYAEKELRDYKKYYRVYKKYDTHYNNAGAFIVHNEILKKLGMKTSELDVLRIDKLDEVDKDLVWMMGQNPDNYTDDFDYYIYYKINNNVNTLFEDHQNSGDVNRWIDIYECPEAEGGGIFFYGDSFKENMKKFIPKDFKLSVFMGDNNTKKADIFKNSIIACDTIVLETSERNETVLFEKMVRDVTNALKALPDVE